MQLRQLSRSCLHHAVHAQ